MSLPSTPSRPARRDNNATLTKTVDNGSPLGVYDANSVRDRVRQWQAQGGGVVTADDVGAETENVQGNPSKIETDEKSKKLRTPSRSHRSKDKDPITPKQIDPSSSKTEKRRYGHSRYGSTPAKRVISDGHWRKKRSPPESVASSKELTNDTTPRWTILDDRIRAKAKSEPRADKRDREVTLSEKESVNGDDGIRVYVTPPGSRRHSERPRRQRSTCSDDEVGSGSEIGVIRSNPPQKTGNARKGPTQAKPPRAGSSASRAEDRRRRRSVQYGRDADESQHSTHGPLSDGKGSMRSHKGNILSQVFGDSRKMFAKHPPEPIATPRVPGIEAWLKETPDPFVDINEGPLEEILPLKPSSRKKSVKSERARSEDPNRIWDALDTKEGTRRAVTGSTRRRRVPSSAIYEANPFNEDFDSNIVLSAGSGKESTSASKLVDLVQETADPSSPSPKRAGAKEESPESSSPSLRGARAKKASSSPNTDRRKSRTPAVSTLDEDAVSRPSSNLTTSSIRGPDAEKSVRSPGLNIKRPFPSTGVHRLSTIASVETFNGKSREAAVPNMSVVSRCPMESKALEEREEARDHFDLDSLKRKNSRLTKHADLISVLSLPRGGSKSIQSARSIRTNRSRLATATIGDLMQELATDENKYMRELRTLVDGVIPVLLTCVLSKSDSAVAVGLFRPSANAHADPNFTRPIVDMGVALERLKILHRRIPHESPAALLTWAHGAQRVYAEYLNAWRMGFQDVVVNLAPAAENVSTAAATSPRPKDLGVEGGLPRNENGDVVNGDGERVDVAFLLKRPLVRLKYLAKTLKGINFIKPSAEAETLSSKYEGLVETARRRSEEERARLEDEAAANIDPTRARDPRTLAPFSGVVIDRARRVRARDHFNLALQHSTGQRVDCRVELLLRDEASEVGHGGDLLICEVDGTGRWLLFPPVQLGFISARNGDIKGEVVVMLRGMSGSGSEWHELFSLVSEEEEAAFEWVQMLGLNPVPPTISRSQSFTSRHHRIKSASDRASLMVAGIPPPTSPGKSRTPSPREVEVPIGEQANDASRIRIETSTSPSPTSNQAPQRDPVRSQQTVDSSPITPSRNTTNYIDQVNDLRSLPSQNRVREPSVREPTRTPRSFKEALGLSGTSTSVGLKRTKAKRQSRHGDSSPLSPRSKRSNYDGDSHATSPEASEIKSRPAGLPTAPDASTSTELKDDSDRSGEDSGAHPRNEDARPQYHRSKSSVPSMDLPYIPKARKNSPPTTPIIAPEEEPVWSTPPPSQHPHSPKKLTKRNPNALSSVIRESAPHSKSVSLKDSQEPGLEKKQPKERRSSSPLKHEYEPSTASESASDSDASTVEHNEATSVSYSSEDESFEDGDVPTPLLPLAELKKVSKASSKPSLYSVPNGSIKPSDSASQAPYKTVPAQPTKTAKTIASIYCWSDSGSWQSLHPDECSIVITPGLIEAFQMSAAHSNSIPLSLPTPVVDADNISDNASNLTSQNDNVGGERPLVALELTPLVPLRRGTAIDISIRSPPTPNSQIISGNNIMFRSRNAEECEALYALINHSRIHNPTFIALQNARGPFVSGKSTGSIDRRPSSRAASARNSWFGGWGRSSSYRASSAPTPSIAPSESSIGSMSSAFSALKRFGRPTSGGLFNIARSTITSREGSRANSAYTSSDNSSGSGTSSPLPPGMANAGKDGTLGLSNAKIRLYIRETASKWRDMGSARLTIMRAERNNVGPDGRPSSSPGQQILHEKRIVVNGKTKGEVLLDAQLGESCFERVARTGIAMSVWEDVVGPNGEVGTVGAVGGVAGGRAKVYMIQVRRT